MTAEPITGELVPMEQATVPAAMTPMAMLSQAVARGASLEMVSKLMDLQERVERGQARRDFDEAIAAAKAEIRPVARNATGHNSKKYANFAAYAKEVDPVLARHGLSYRFRTEQDGAIKVTCVLSHKNGHSEENSLSGPADTSGNKNNIQAIGSTLTYLQRYTLTQALGLAASDDDDGKTSEALPVSVAAEAAINALEQIKDKPALAKWRSDNDAMIRKFDRNDFAAVRRAFEAHQATLGGAQ